MCSAQPSVTGNDLLAAINACEHIAGHERADLLVHAQSMCRRLAASSHDEFVARTRTIGERIQALVRIVDTRKLDPWIECSSIFDSFMLADVLDVAAVAQVLYRHSEPYFDPDDFIRLLGARLPASFVK